MSSLLYLHKRRPLLISLFLISNKIFLQQSFIRISMACTINCNYQKLFLIEKKFPPVSICLTLPIFYNSEVISVELSVQVAGNIPDSFLNKNNISKQKFSFYEQKFIIYEQKFNIYKQNFNIYEQKFNIYEQKFNVYEHKFNIMNRNSLFMDRNSIFMNRNSTFMNRNLMFMNKNLIL